MTAAAWKPGIVLSAIDLTPTNILAIKAALPPAETCAITMWREAEARLEHGHWTPNPVAAMIDILEVIDYRVQRPRWRARGHKGVCLDRWAFSCWEPTGGPDDLKDDDKLAENFEAVMYAAQRLLAGTKAVGKLAECLDVAHACIVNQLQHTLPPDTCHYHTTWLALPDWAYIDKAKTKRRTPCAERYGHLFYSGVP